MQEPAAASPAVHRSRFAAFAAVALALAIAASGCLDRPSHEDVALFAIPGSFEAAVDAGADVWSARAAEDAAPQVPMSPTPDLDAAWGAGRYQLASIHWWGPQGPPAPAEDDGIVRADLGSWQGFLLHGDHLQLLGGSVDPALQRRLGDLFLQNVTTLDAGGRAAFLDRFMAGGACLPCTSPAPEGLDGARAWRRVGGLDQAEPGVAQQGGRLVAGSWWFDFDLDRATLRSDAGEGRTVIEVGANDVGSFAWQSDRTHGDAQSYAVLREAFGRHGLAAPPAQDLAWDHREIAWDD